MGRHDKAETKLKLIKTAERLFADRGLDGVSLRQINVASGQRNASALHYHFGSREALIEAIFAHRMMPIDIRRNEMVDELIASGRDSNIRAIMKAKVLPLAEQLDPSSDGNNYLRFFSEIWSSPKLDFRKLVAGKYDRGVIRANKLAIEVLNHLPESLVRQRLIVETGSTITALAALERRMMEKALPICHENAELAVENLIDMAAGAVAGPVSDKVIGAYGGKTDDFVR